VISSNPKLPQFGPGDSPEFVARSFWSLFQERFYTLWRELVTAMEKLVQGPATSTDNQVVRFDGTSGSLVQGSDVYVTDDGRLYGTALHNNTGAVTGTTNQYVASGTYTPTATAVTNCDAVSSNFVAQWIRVGNVVTVSGWCDVDANDATATVEFRISLPIASALAFLNQVGGVGRESGRSGGSFRIYADSTNDQAFFSGGMSTASNSNISFTFTYLVL
jgi:hypothetical protein